MPMHSFHILGSLGSITFLVASRRAKSYSRATKSRVTVSSASDRISFPSNVSHYLHVLYGGPSPSPRSTHVYPDVCGSGQLGKKDHASP